jgi:Ni,Fe-hydrogenase III small subunit
MTPVNGAIRQEPEIAVLKQRLLKDIRRSIYVYRIDCGGCNGCEIEIFASLTSLFDVERFGIKVVPTPRHADILVCTGPMTRAMRLPALRAYNAAPDPKLVVAYGACGCSGGIFHDSYAVWGGAAAIFPVDLFIPGCPPTPGATIHGFATAIGVLDQKIKAEHHVDEGPATAEPPAATGLPPGLAREIGREARRLCGYWQGKQVAQQFLDLVAASVSSLPADAAPGEGTPPPHPGLQPGLKECGAQAHPGLPPGLKNAECMSPFRKLAELVEAETDERRREIFKLLHRHCLEGRSSIRP